MIIETSIRVTTLSMNDTNEGKAPKPAKATKSELAKFKTEQTKKTNQEIKRRGLAKTLPKNDMRNAGIILQQMNGLKEMLGTRKCVSA